MKGILFNVLEDVVSEEHGADAWDDLLERTDVDGAYTAIGNYADAEFVRLLQALPGADETPARVALRAFGRAAMHRMAAVYPAFFRPHVSTPAFLMTVNDIIHPAVRCLYPGADVPVFDVTPDEATGELVIAYRSGRRLCHLAEGFVAGAAEHFGERAEVVQTSCMHTGAAACVLRCAFTAPAGARERP